MNGSNISIAFKKGEGGSGESGGSGETRESGEGCGSRYFWVVRIVRRDARHCVSRTAYKPGGLLIRPAGGYPLNLGCLCASRFYIWLIIKFQAGFAGIKFINRRLDAMHCVSTGIITLSRIPTSGFFQARAGCQCC